MDIRINHSNREEMRDGCKSLGSLAGNTNFVSILRNLDTNHSGSRDQINFADDSESIRTFSDQRLGGAATKCSPAAQSVNGLK
jgi:hypothetical protein